MDEARKPAEACACGGGLHGGLWEQEAERLRLLGEEAGAFVQPYRVAALSHDFDYERHPSLDEHVWVGNRVLTEQGWPGPVRHVILAHADYTNTPGESHLDCALFACDELSGFLTACALVKPSKSIHDVEVAGVKKNERQGLCAWRAARRPRKRYGFTEYFD